jgi:hypothetical protein
MDREKTCDFDVYISYKYRLNDGHGYTTVEEGYPNESQYLIERIDGKTVVKTDGGGLNKGDIINCICIQMALR